MPTYSVVAADGQLYGPADENVLAQWAREGRINGQTALHCHETNQRVWAQSVPSLAPLVGLSQPMVNHLMQPPGVQPAQQYAQQQAQGYQQPYGQPQAYGQSLGYAQPGGYALAPGSHALTEFSTPVAILLHYCTFGIFSWIHYGLMHDKLPRVRHDDPSGTKAICFMLIPFFNVFYWRFFEGMRLCDRINEQRSVAGLPPTAPRGMAIAYGVVMLIPYFNLLIGFPIMGPIYYGMVRASVNELVAATHGRR